MRYLEYLELAISIAVLYGITQTEGKPKLICYFSNWASPYKNPFQFGINDIPYDLCDVLVWYHNSLSTNDTFTIVSSDFATKNEYTLLKNAQRKRIPVYLALGSYNVNLAEFSKMRCLENRRQFSKNLVRYMSRQLLLPEDLFFSGDTFTTKLYSGLLIDWGYPGMNGNVDDKITFSRILQTLDPLFRRMNWTLAISGASDENIIEKGYDLDEINRYVDEVHVYCHHLPDFYKNTEESKDHSPLYSIHSWMDSVEKVMSFWNRDIPKKKLYVTVYILGVPRGFASGKELAYFEICTYLMVGQLKEVWNSASKAAHATNKGLFTNTLISYETTESLKEKARFVQREGYGGIAFKFINVDDFRGLCGRKNALLKSIHEVFEGP